MENFRMSSSNGIGLGYSLPPQGNYHGQLFEFIADNISDPIIYYWHDGIGKWIPLPYNSNSNNGSSIDGAIFITDVRPQNLSDNISNKIYVDDTNIELKSFISTTSLIIVDILIITGHSHYKPSGTINGLNITNISALSDKTLFKATMNIDLNKKNIIKVEHEDGAYSEIDVSYIGLPKISSVTFLNDYPLTKGIIQTELKENDKVSVNIKTDKDIIKVEIDDYGACKSQSFNVSASSDILLSSVVIANRGTTSQLLGVKLKVQSNDGGWSDWFNSDSLGDVEKVNVVKLNNTYPTINITNIIYPIGQQALKDSENAIISNTASNYDTIVYSSPNNDLNIVNNGIFEDNKAVNRIGGNYNITISNFQIIAYRNANGSNAKINGVVNIANVEPIINITEQYTRLRSSETGSNYWIKIMSNQKLLNTPTLTCPVGTFINDFATNDNMTWQKTISISDSDIKGIYNYTSMSSTNLAGKIVTVITGDEEIVIGGCMNRKLTFSAFESMVYIGCNVTDITKVQVVDLSNYIFSYQSSLDNNSLTYTIVDSKGNLNNNGDYLKITDNNIISQNSTGNYYVYFEELV